MRIFCLMLCVFSIVFQGYSQLTIIENSSEQMVLQWKINSMDTVSVSTENNLHTVISFRGQNAVLGSYGTPALPAYSFCIGVPQEGEIDISENVENVESIHLFYPPLQQKDSSKQIQINFESEWISKPIYSTIGSIRIAHIFIRPVIYSSDMINTKVLLSGKVTIRFPASNSRRILSESPMSKMLKSLLINYSVAQYWGMSNLAKKSTENYPLQYSQKKVCFKIGDGHNLVNEGTTDENGIIKITGYSIIRELGANCPIARISLFASYKGILPEEPPEAGMIPNGITEIPLYRYDQNGNGTIDTNDYVLAFVSSLSDWTYKSNYEFSIDPYDESRTYWMTIKNQNGLTIEKFIQPGSGSIPREYFVNRKFFKQSILHAKEREYGGNNWVWKKMDNKDHGFTYFFDLPSLDSSSLGSITTYYTPMQGSIKGKYGNVPIQADNGIADTIYNWKNNSLELDFLADYDTSYCELNSVLFEYQSKLLLTGDTIRKMIFSVNEEGIISYRLSNPTKQKIYLFRINSDETTMSLVDTFRTVNYSWSDTGNRGIRYYAFNENGFFKTPEFIQVNNLQNDKYLVHDLRNNSYKTDYLIITHPQFIAESQILAGHKSKFGFKNPVIVDVNEIFQSFSGGNKDPTAIRNFLAYVKRNWSGSSDLFYVVIMGNGHYDPKYYQTKEIDFVPIYQYGETLQEDYFSYLEPKHQNDYDFTDKPQLIIGRFPCKAKAEAAAMVNKIIDMEDPERTDLGSWRNRALLVADDDMQLKDEDDIKHYVSTERVADIILSNCPSIDLRKLYQFDFEWNYVDEKPGVTQALLNEINNGVAYVNFFGHGSEGQWADEKVLKNENVLSMRNNKQYPVIASFSCDVGRFDLPGVECLSSALVKAPNSGACIAISSTRLANAFSNENMAISLYTDLFNVSNNIIGAAYYATKIKSTYSSQSAYAFFGDPSLQMVRPEKSIELNVMDAAGAVITSMKALQKVKITGSIRKADKSIDTDFGNGTKSAFINLSLFNVPDTNLRKDGGKDNTIKYLMPGAPVFQGKTSVQNGKFEQIVNLPKRVTFDIPGVKLTGYAWVEKEMSVAIGVNTNLIFSGTDTAGFNKNDSTGPRITIRPVYDNSNQGFSDVSFTDHITSSLPVRFQIDLYDESGIDALGNQPDEGLIYEINGALSKRNINSKFQFKTGSVQEGSASVEIEDKSIKPGKYDLIIYARDFPGNMSMKTFSLEITDKNDLKLDHVFNFPNPFRIGQTTRFFFYGSNSNVITSQPAVFYIKIYSLSGRLLRVFLNANNGVAWDGRDQVGNMLSPNVYLYQVSAYNSYSQKNVKSKIKKIVIHPPR